MVLMSVYYIWVCDAVKQWMSPYPLDAPHLYVWMQTYLDDSGIRGWSGESIRLINDSGDADEYYLRTCDPADSDQLAAWGGTPADCYIDVTAKALALAADYYPDRWWQRQ